MKASGKSDEKDKHVTSDTPRHDSLKTDWLGLCAPPRPQSGKSKMGHIWLRDEATYI